MDCFEPLFSRETAMLHEDSTQIPLSTASTQESPAESGASRTLERRKRYPGILSKVASGSPEDAALAVLKGELALPATGASQGEGGSDDGDAKPEG